MAISAAPCVDFDGIHVLLFSVVTPEEKLSTLPGEVKFDRDRDILFIRCQVERLLIKRNKIGCSWPKNLIHNKAHE